MTVDRPNILVFYADQMRADAMGCSGNSFVRTPRLDQLAEEGVRFANAFVSYPWCTPFRASLFTGKYAQGHGLYQNHFPIRTDQRFLAQLLADEGYNTGYIGKWHLDGGPKPGYVPPGERRLGFDHFVGFNRGHAYLDSIYYRDTPQPYTSDRFEPDYQTDHLLDFIDAAIDHPDQKPFFGMVCYGPPHHPMHMSNEVRSAYDPDAVPLPLGTPDAALQEAFQAERFDVECAGDDNARHSSKAKQEKVPGIAETEAEIRRFVAEYYSLVTHVDGLVGKVLDHLDDVGAADNTIVIFLSDHGDMLGQHGYYCGYKSTAYKAAAHVPFIVRYPARFNPAVVEAPIDIAVDTFSTILQLCGIDVPEEQQGVSYLSLLNGSTEPTRDAVMYQSMRQQSGQRAEFNPVPERGIRTTNWLYVRQPERRKLLIDLRNDPNELNNLASDPAYAEVMDDLDQQLFEFMADTDDDWELHLPWPPPDFVTHGEGRRLMDEELLPNAIMEEPR